MEDNTDKVKQLLIKIEERLHTEFKTVASQQKTTMTDVIIELIRSYVLTYKEGELKNIQK